MPPSRWTAGRAPGMSIDMMTARIFWMACLIAPALANGGFLKAADPPAQEAHASPTSGLPEGDKGIAARHPGDQGIAGDPKVLFADDFESYAAIAELRARWDTVHHEAHLALIPESTPDLSGRQALQLTLPAQQAELSHAIARSLAPERDTVFLRYYAKFDPPFDIVGSSHNGCTVSGRYFENGRATPGVPADGRNKFLAALEHWRGEAATPAPGQLNVYLYHPEQRSQWGDHFFPSGTVLPNSSRRFDFGPDFVGRPDIVPTIGKWHCYEFMVVLNAPGRRDGRIACWLDGRLAADFPNLRLRDIPELKIDRYGLNLHAGSNPKGMARQAVDAVVVATAYIGPQVGVRPKR